MVLGVLLQAVPAVLIPLLTDRLVRLAMTVAGDAKRFILRLFVLQQEVLQIRVWLRVLSF